MTNKVSSDAVGRRFLDEVKHHLRGWQTKINKDFSSQSYQRELANLRGDPVYSKFALDCPEYVLVRLMGRVSISVGRRLGEIYDKLPRFVASARFGVTPEQVAEKFSGLELDIGLRYEALSRQDVSHVKEVLKTFGKETVTREGLGIEIRYNFNPNDSARLRKDVAMAGYLLEANLLPVYLIYSSISPRNDAISRLTRAGWLFLQGDKAAEFTTRLFAVDFLGLMEQQEVRKEIHDEVRKILGSIYTSDAFKQALQT